MILFKWCKTWNSSIAQHFIMQYKDRNVLVTICQTQRTGKKNNIAFCFVYWFIERIHDAIWGSLCDWRTDWMTGCSINLRGSPPVRKIIIITVPQIQVFCSCWYATTTAAATFDSHNDIKTLWYRIKCSCILYQCCTTHSNNNRTTT